MNIGSDQMNYKIGDVVIRKDEERKVYAEKFIFIGTTENNTAKPIIITKQVMGGKVEIGMFIHKPVEVSYNDDHDNYVIDVLFYSTELFEKDE